MPSVYQSDLHRYVTKNDMRQLRRYQGKAIFMPDGRGVGYMNRFGDVEVNGDGFFDTVSGFFRSSNPVEKFFKDNKGAIGSVLDVVGKVGSTAMDIAKGAEEIKTLREMREQMQQMRQQQPQQQKSGSAIYMPDKDTGNGISLRTPRIMGNTVANEVADNIATHSGRGFKILNS